LLWLSRLALRCGEGWSLGLGLGLRLGLTAERGGDRGALLFAEEEDALLDCAGGAA